MFDNSDLPNGSVQFTISHEVILFLRWLMENHPEELKKLSVKALQDGLLSQLQNVEDTLPDEETQNVIIDFFNHIEIIMHEAIGEHALNQAQHAQLQNTIDHIDGTLCDDHTVKASLETAASYHASHPEKSPQELLFKEILKQWRPHNSELLN